VKHLLAKVVTVASSGITFTYRSQCGIEDPDLYPFYSKEFYCQGLIGSGVMLSDFSDAFLRWLRTRQSQPWFVKVLERT
jgi:hypothetical protein